MKLKCIGGPNDGEYKETYDKRWGDLIAIQQFEPMPIVTSFDSSVPEITTVSAEFYKVEKIGWHQDGKSKEWSFLLHEKLTILDIFDKLFA